MKSLLIIFISISMANEMEIDGDLKVFGHINANGNAITNVGSPQSMTDAINGNVLQDALRDDTEYEYKMILIRISDNGQSTNMWGHEYGHDTSDDWNYSYYNNLISLLESNWTFYKEVHLGVQSGYFKFILILKRPISDIPNGSYGNLNLPKDTNLANNPKIW